MPYRSDAQRVAVREYVKLPIGRAKRGSLGIPRGKTLKERSTYLKTWRKANPQRERLYKPKHYPVINANRRKLAQELRGEVLFLFGGQCSVCGFVDQRALEIHHTNGDGRKHRNRCGTGVKFYRDIIASAKTGQYEVLCANCHLIKTRDKGHWNHAI